MTDKNNNLDERDNNSEFNLPPEVLDEIQQNIEEIIANFPVPENNKLDVIRKINFMYSHSRHLSLTDPLTGLYNRRHLDFELEREFLRAGRYNSSMSIAIADIDFFKKINDTYGHICGDFILKETAYILVNALRKTDLVFRYGGEEFVILLPETPIEKAEIPLERLRKTIQDYCFKYKNYDIKITISMGAAGINENIKYTSQLLDNADKALYLAKESGRNCLKLSH